jgi:hypothetical protein
MVGGEIHMTTQLLRLQKLNRIILLTCLKN